MTKAEHRKMSQIVRKIKRGIQAVREERAEKIQREGRLAKAPGGGTGRHFNSGHDSHAQKRLAYPWTNPRSTYAHLLNNPTCQPGDTEEARRMVSRILSLIDLGGWSKAAGQTWANKAQNLAYDQIASLIRCKGDRAYKFVLEQLIPSTRLGDRQGAWRVLWAIHELLQRGKLTEDQRAQLTGLFQVWGARAEGSGHQRSRARKLAAEKVKRVSRR